MNNPLLEIEQLSIQFDDFKAVDSISFNIYAGETLGIVGESGSGKSLTALSLLRLTPKTATISGNIKYYPSANQYINLVQLPNNQLPQYRGSQIAIVFQEPMSALNPVMTCGQQIEEVLQKHQVISSVNRKQQVLDLLSAVQLEKPNRIYEAYPYQLSGGQKQRIMLAMAISCKPKLIIADEPTTALDVIIQKTILDLLKKYQQQQQSALLFISHDLDIVARLADRVLVMQNGQIVESGTVKEIFQCPKHPYTKMLLASKPPQQKVYRLPSSNSDTDTSIIPREILNNRAKQLEESPILLKLENISKQYVQTSNWWGKPTAFTKAVRNVSFQIHQGETLGLVGPSGCGKSTLSNVILGLSSIHSGAIYFDGQRIDTLSEKAMRPIRKDLQIIFQDPLSSLNPRQMIGYAITEPMQLHGIEDKKSIREQKAINLLEQVGLKADHFFQYPHQFSGGQRQRICIARALASQPKLIICDECVSALDVSIQAQILNLLLDLRATYQLSYLFISHDLSVVQFISDRIAVMENGNIVEMNMAHRLFESPKHPLTQQLKLSSR